jgi:hypothetical protein
MTDCGSSERSVAEAVIISGPRKGEIVTLDLARQEIVDSEIYRLLGVALRDMDGALARLRDSIREWREEIRVHDAAAVDDVKGTGAP